MYSNSCCSSSFETEIIKIRQAFHKMYSNNILNIQEFTPILNAHTKKSGILLNAPRIIPCSLCILSLKMTESGVAYFFSNIIVLSVLVHHISNVIILYFAYDTIYPPEY